MRWSIAAVVSLALLPVGCSSDTSNAAATLDAFVAAYNAEDLEGVVAFFDDGSVMTAHPAGPVAGGAVEIEGVFADDVGLGLSTAVSNVSVEVFPADEVTGSESYSWVRWDQTWWSNENGQTDEFCWSGHSAVISNGTFARLNWSRFECP